MTGPLKHRSAPDIHAENIRLRHQVAELEQMVAHLSRERRGAHHRSFITQSDAQTAYKRMAELTRANQELQTMLLERTRTEEEMEMFSYAVAHSLRTPLAIISACTDDLLEEWAENLPCVERDDLYRIQRAVKHMDHMIDNLLNFAQITGRQMRLERVDLSSLAREITALWHDIPRREVEVTIADGMEAIGDPRLLRIVLENLLNNAWKFTRNHPHARIEFGMARYDEQDIYFVRDNGIGFDQGQAHQLFGPFQRLHSRLDFPGTGIGLALVRRIIYRHEGRVWAEGRPGEGAIFFFTLGLAGELRSYPL